MLTDVSTRFAPFVGGFHLCDTDYDKGERPWGLEARRGDSCDSASPHWDGGHVNRWVNRDQAASFRGAGFTATLCRFG